MKLEIIKSKDTRQLNYSTKAVAYSGSFGLWSRRYPNLEEAKEWAEQDFKREYQGSTKAQKLVLREQKGGMSFSKIAEYQKFREGI